MGKTFRRGGAERGYSSPGKSLRDKRQRGASNKSTSWEYKDSPNTKRVTKNQPYDVKDYEWRRNARNARNDSFGLTSHSGKFESRGESVDYFDTRFRRFWILVRILESLWEIPGILTRLS